jgi:hypothetical protein
MKALTIDNTKRQTLIAPLFLCALLCCFVFASGIDADDPDDDWGLPTLTDEDDPPDDSEEQGSGGPDSDTDIRVAVEVQPTELNPMIGQILLDRQNHTGTTVTHEGLPGQMAELNSPDSSSPVQAAQLDDGIAVQGFARLRLPLKGEGSLAARLLTPDGGHDVRAFVIIDQLGSLQELVSDPSSIPVGVTAFIPLPCGITSLNLNAFQNVVDTYGEKFVEGHISVVILSLDDQDELHVTAARLARDGGIMEIVAK